jgi:hypothetical protein
LVYPPNGKGLAGESKPDPAVRANLIAKLGLTQEEAALLRLL